MSRPLVGMVSSPGGGAQKREAQASLFLFMQEPAVAYILYSERLDKYYVGKSENFTQRLKIHNSDENEKWSRLGRPWMEFLRIECKSYKQAGKIERYIKAQKSRKYIEQLKDKPDYVLNLLERFAHDC